MDRSKGRWCRRGGYQGGVPMHNPFIPLHLNIPPAPYKLYYSSLFRTFPKFICIFEYSLYVYTLGYIVLFSKHQRYSNSGMTAWIPQWDSDLST